MKHQQTIRRGRMPFYAAVLAVLFLLFGAGTGAYASGWEEDEEVFITQSIMLTYEGNQVSTVLGDESLFVLCRDLNMDIEMSVEEVLQESDELDLVFSDPEYFSLFKYEPFPGYGMWYIDFLKFPEEGHPQWFELTVGGKTYHVDVSGSGEPSWNDLYNTLVDMDDGQILRLPCDFKAKPGDTSILIFSTFGKTITLDLNGHTLDAEGVENGFALANMGANIVIMDSSGDHSGRITGGHDSSAIVILGGTVTLESGSISGNSGGGVTVSGTYSTNGQSGDTGMFIMNGGSIRGNEAEGGGGVFVNDGIFVMNGGSITGNTTEKGGGGVYLSGGSFTFSGGSILNNTAGTRGGGVMVTNEAEFIVSGSPRLSGNTAALQGNNVFLMGETGITLQDSLGAGTILTLAAEISGRTVTKGLPGNGSADNFQAEEEGWILISGSDGELMFGKEASLDFYNGEEAGQPVLHLLVLQDQEYVLPDPATVDGIIIPDGQVFYGWKTGGEFFEPGEPIRLSQAVNSVFGVCSDPYWTVQFAAGHEEASGSMKPVKVLKGNELTLPPCGFGEPEGHSFAGWQVGEETKAAEKNIPVTEDMTVTALWSLNEYTATFSAGEGTGWLDPITALYGTEITLPKCGFTPPEGKTFGSWSVEGKNPHYAAGDTFILTGDTLIQPRWVGLWGDLQRRINEAEDGEVLALLGDTLAESSDGWLIVPENKKITIDLNGYTLDRNLDKYAIDSIAWIKGSLTIRDSSEGGTGTITGGTDSGLYVDGGSLVLEGGTITGNSGKSGGGICVEQGSLIMRGGCISHNTALTGAGISLWNGSFRLEGGVIRDNACLIIEGAVEKTNAGGVYLQDADFTMTGGVIRGNTAQIGGGLEFYYVDAVISGGEICDNTSERGGGIYVWAGGTLDISGGTITGNRAEQSFGGGILLDYMWEPVIMNMSGGVISGNYAGLYGGGIFSSRGEITLSGGTIMGNSAGTRGGGINLTNGNLYLKDSPFVSGNTAGDGVSNLFLNKLLTVTGELSEEALIGIQHQNAPSEGKPRVFTSGFSGKGTKGAFFSDKPDYCIHVDSDGEAVLMVIPEACTPTFILPAGTTAIGESAFENDLMITVADAGSCSAIGARAFSGCENLTQIRLPQDCLIDPAAFDHPVFVFAPSGGTTKQCCDTQNNLIFVPTDP